MKKGKLLVVLTLILGGLFLSTITVFAEANENNGPVMTVSPPQQKMVLVPGESFEGSVKVSNTAGTDRDLKYSVTVGSFNLGKDENGNTDYNYTDTETITSYNQIMDWIELKKTGGSVAPNTTDTIPFVINVPEDAPSGGQYATIIIQDDTKVEEGNGGNVAINNVIRFAVSIIAEVTGETRDEGDIIENSIPSFVINGKLSAVSKVRNDGNVHANARYVLQVWPLFSDEELCTNEEEPNESLVMPGTERTHAEECSLPAFGIFRAKQTVKIFNEISEVEKYVFVCPLWLLFIIIFVIIMIVMWLVMRLRGRSKQTA